METKINRLSHCQSGLIRRITTVILISVMHMTSFGQESTLSKLNIAYKDGSGENPMITYTYWDAYAPGTGRIMKYNLYLGNSDHSFGIKDVVRDSYPFILDAGGRIGVGGQAPRHDASFNVFGNQYITSQSNGLTIEALTGNPGLQFISPKRNRSYTVFADDRGRCGFYDGKSQRDVFAIDSLGYIESPRLTGQLRLFDTDKNKNSFQIYAGLSGSSLYGWIGTTTNHGLYIGTNNNSKMYLDNLGNVFLGSFNSYSFPEAQKKYNLFIQKGVLSPDYAMAPVSSWSDHVFSEKYPLAKLAEVEAYINKYHHLPNIPSEEEVKKDGYSVHEMTTRLLEKVEELTLHIISQQKEIEELKRQLPKKKKWD